MTQIRLLANRFFSTRRVNPRFHLLQLQRSYEAGIISRGKYESQRTRILGSC